MLRLLPATSINLSIFHIIQTNTHKANKTSIYFILISKTFFFFCFVFWVRSHGIVQAGFELMAILLSQPQKCSEYRYETPPPAFSFSHFNIFEIRMHLQSRIGYKLKGSSSFLGDFSFSEVQKTNGVSPHQLYLSLNELYQESAVTSLQAALGIHRFSLLHQWIKTNQNTNGTVSVLNTCRSFSSLPLQCYNELTRH